MSLNERLWRGQETSLTPQELGQVQGLRIALGKLPNHDGLVYRIADIGPRGFDKYVEGKVITEPAFISTTKDEEPMPGEGSDGTSIMVFWIKSRTGKDISQVSQAPENEILFSPGTRFLVRRAKGNFVALEEVP